MNDSKLYGKWFWVGVVITLLNFLAGLIFATAFYLEPEHKKEGQLLAVWSLIVFLFYVYVIVPFLTNQGLLPKI